nr:DNA replication complex GINS protein PSF2 [Pelodiscus sinensis]|eukprot:XP_006137430.1 DNA replication complex GINS protein PSF2 [Pelodiscus sinensis]
MDGRCFFQLQTDSTTFLKLLNRQFIVQEKLEEIRDKERKEDTFTPMPNPYYMELTKLLLNYASDSIPKADEIRTLVKDTWDTRLAKLRLSADSFVRQQEAHAKLDNLTLMEINTTGTFLTQALDHMYKLRTNLQPGESAQSQDF